MARARNRARRPRPSFNRNGMTLQIETHALADYPSWTADAGAGTPRATGKLRRVKALVLLSGALRSTPLSAAIRRSLLDLPVSPGVTLLDLWCEQAAALAAAAGVARLPVRILRDE